MPEEKIHQEKKVKNYLLLIIFLLFVVVVFSVTILKLSAAGKRIMSEQSQTNGNAKANEEK